MQSELLEGFQLSPQQRRLWLLPEDSGTFNAQCTVLLEGNLDRNRLERSFRNVAERHEILRTTFQRLPGIKIPVQVVAQSLSPAWTNLDLSDLHPAEQQARLEEVLRTMRATRLDYEQGPLLHLCLITLSSVKSILLVTMPALCADAETLKNLVSELSDSYAADAEDAELSEETMTYAQFAEWQDELLAEDIAGKEYWQKRMAALGPEQVLPYQLKPTGVTTFSPQALPLKLDSSLVQDVDALAHKSKVSTPSFLLACWQTLLWRLTGQPEILVGIVYGEEKYEVLRGVLGPFAKILPAGMHFEGGFNFAEILKRTDEVVRDVFDWAEYLNPEESSSPLTAIFEHYDCGESHRAASLSFSIEGLYTCMDQFGLKLSCVRKDHALLAELHYDANRFRTTDVERLADEFVTLLESITKNPEAGIRELEILSQGERDRLLFEFNSKPRQAPAAECFHELFEKQVQRTPHAAAVQFEDEQLTYAQLNERANQLAHYLRRRGVGPEKLVGIYLERSLEMIVSLLGILKSGAAYVSLDPGYPSERVKLLLAQANDPPVVTVERLKESLPGESKVVCIDTEWKIIESEGKQNPDNLSAGANLVYVLFTSGSTGQPKGVAVEHRQLVNYLEGITGSLNPAPGASFATVSTLSADLGNTVIYLSLSSGGCLHVISQQRITDAEAMADYMSRHNVDCLKIVPSHLKALLTASHPEKILPRQCLVLGGEASSIEWIEKLQSLDPDRTIFNHYGPTETTVGVATFKLDELPGDTQTLPIGRPLSGTQIYLLDSDLRLVPIGVPGEICVGGAGLARGYLDHPAATAEKFIPNSFALEPGERLYRTGDLGRHLPNGQIEFLGRTDHQVKIRGFRIELGEIEAVLTTHELVRQCVLLAREDVPGNKQLVAYVVAERDAALTVSDLRDYLKQRLPDYMMPAAFVLLDELPLTRNGKVDRDALPAPEESKGLEAARGPATWCEELLIEIWAEVLNRSVINTNANFFDLGGHSLLATQLISRIREVFRVEMPLRSVFDAPTVERLAKRIEMARREGVSGVAAGELKRVERAEPMPLSFAQQRLWFLSKLEPESPLYNTRHVVMLTGRLDVDALQKTLDEVVRRHETLRTTFKEVDGAPVQVIAPPQPSPLTITDLTALDQESQELQVKSLDVEEGNHPFDLAAGPLFRATLVKLSSEKHVAMFTTHHIISDFWSMGVLIREVAQLYSAFVKGESSPLPELEIQYADFAYWQRQWLQGESLEAELDFWKRQLAGAPPTLDLPTDKPRPAQPSYQSETYSERLSPSLTAAVHGVARREGATIFMTMLAAFNALLYFYTRQDDISVGTPIAGRNRGEVENLIGCFLNTLVLRTDLSDDPDFAEMLRRVREVTLDAYTHQDLPFERLVQELQPKRDLNRTPLFQALMVFHNNLKTSAELPELTLTSMGFAKQRTNFDLTLWATEGPDGILVTFEYNTDLFERATIGNMVERFRMLLESVAAKPELRLSEIALLNESERRQILIEWNNTSRPYPTDSCFQELFEAQVVRTPDAVAVSCEGQSLTYAQLNQRSNQLAHVLASQGVGPDVVVALLADRGLDLLTTILAVFKAGGAYLPLDTRAPANRLRQVITQSATPLVLASSSYRPFLMQALEELPAAERPSVPEIEAMLGHDLQEGNLPLRNSPHSLAYVIYTSGSTGVPKGAMIEQRGMVNHLYAKIDDLALTATDKVAQTASQSFDISVWQMLAALVIGGQVEIIGDLVAHDAVQLLPRIEKEGVTIVETVPSLLRALLDDTSVSNLSALRWMIPTGEALSPDLCRRWLAAYPQVSLLNAYGPTECSDDVSHHPIHEVTAAEENNVPIGRPVGNTRLYIVDKHLRALPVGVPGELCVGGTGVGRGYLREPARTADVFVPDPFSEDGGGRLYRTGDLACWRADGSVEFLGRIDHQVKIRGYRIETAEIEVVLEGHENVGEALVTVREDIPGDKRLVAYVVATTPVAGELRDYLKEKLPEYMVPSAFVMLDQMPLTPNGKIDRRALPAPDMSRPETTPFVAPRNATEETLAGIFLKVLNLQQVGVHDDFFELGGHSLLATQVISRLREAFNVEMPLREIFEHPTIDELAQVISTLQMQQLEREQREVMEKVDQLSEAEVEAMLAQLSN